MHFDDLMYLLKILSDPMSILGILFVIFFIAVGVLLRGDPRNSDTGAHFGSLGAIGDGDGDGDGDSC